MHKGFTLAEVLVTLGIIGVVSAMTIPTLMRNHQKTVYVNQLKKVYSMIAQAADMALHDNNAVSLAENEFNEYFKVVQTCTDSITPCFAEKYKNLDGDVVLEKTDTRIGKCVSLASGSALCTTDGFRNDYKYSNGEIIHGFIRLIIDLNGQEGPNIAGRDLFTVNIYTDGKVTETYDSSYLTPENLTERKAICIEGDTSYSGGCFTTIMYSGWKMDY